MELETKEVPETKTQGSLILITFEQMLLHGLCKFTVRIRKSVEGDRSCPGVALSERAGSDPHKNIQYTRITRTTSLVVIITFMSVVYIWVRLDWNASDYSTTCATVKSFPEIMQLNLLIYTKEPHRQGPTAPIRQMQRACGAFLRHLPSMHLKCKMLIKFVGRRIAL